VLARLQQADPSPPIATSGLAGQRIPAEHFGADQGATEALALMARTEKLAAAGIDVYAMDTPAGRVQAFANFVSTHAHVLAAIPGETLTMARNHAATGIVAEKAEALTAPFTKPWLTRDPRPPALPGWPACLRTLEGHANRVNSVALAPDGKTVVSGGSDA